MMMYNNEQTVEFTFQQHVNIFICYVRIYQCVWTLPQEFWILCIILYTHSKNILYNYYYMCNSLASAFNLVRTLFVSRKHMMAVCTTKRGTLEYKLCKYWQLVKKNKQILL